MKRTPAGSLRAADAGQRVKLQGWVGRRRDLGELIFLTIRDRSGTAQVVFDRARCSSESVDRAAEARGEDVVEIEEEVLLRGEGQRRADSATGEVEVLASGLVFLARAETPPFTIEDRTNATEELRLEYRYLDLRRPAMQKNMMLRDEITARIRNALRDRDFVEIETPMLTQSSPEGARDYLVPSRVNTGTFYALPQSPQLYKQLLMVAGLTGTSRSRSASGTRICAPTASRSSRRSIWRCLFPRRRLFGRSTGCWRKALRDHWRHGRAPVPSHDIPSGHGHLRDRCAGPAVRTCLGGPFGDGAGSGFAPLTNRSSPAGPCAGVRVPGGAAFSRKTPRRAGGVGAKHGAEGLVWVKTEAALSSPAKKHLRRGLLDRICGKGGGRRWGICF